MVQKPEDEKPGDRKFKDDEIDLGPPKLRRPEPKEEPQPKTEPVAPPDMSRPISGTGG